MVQFRCAAQSASLKPVRMKPSPTRIGRLTSIPSVASRSSCSCSLMAGSLSFRPMDLYSRPEVLKNFFRGRPPRCYHWCSSSAVGFCSLMLRSS